MKVIFLDIDGVLNSVDSAIAFHALKQGINYETNEQRLDAVSIGLLKGLCDKTGAKIVVSSTWRLTRNINDFSRIFAAYGWKDFPVIDVTPIEYKILHSARGGEIQDWLTEHPEVTEYIILDDDSDMLPSQLGRFVHVSNISGFRGKHYCQCLRLFGIPDVRLEQQVNWTKQV